MADEPTGEFKKIAERVKEGTVEEKTKSSNGEMVKNASQMTFFTVMSELQEANQGVDTENTFGSRAFHH